MMQVAPERVMYTKLDIYLMSALIFTCWWHILLKITNFWNFYNFGIIVNIAVDFLPKIDPT